MLVSLGFNKWTTRKSRWHETVFSYVRTYIDPEGTKRTVLSTRGNYVRTIWDWLFRRYRVPLPVAEEMLRDGLIEQYVPVTFEDTGERIALVKCNKQTYGVYMDYGAVT